MKGGKNPDFGIAYKRASSGLDLKVSHEGLQSETLGFTKFDISGAEVAFEKNKAGTLAITLNRGNMGEEVYQARVRVELSAILDKKTNRHPPGKLFGRC